jgi:hypothetical protein
MSGHPNQMGQMLKYFLTKAVFHPNFSLELAWSDG